MLFNFKFDKFNDILQTLHIHEDFEIHIGNSTSDRSHTVKQSKKFKFLFYSTEISRS